MMSEAPRQTQIRQGFNQYIGAVLLNPDFSPKENRHLVVAMLCEEAIKIITSNDSIDDDFYIDDYACKPYLKGFEYLMERNIARAKKEAPEEMLDEVSRYFHTEWGRFKNNVLNSWTGEDKNVG